jgi:hypothetical protein
MVEVFENDFERFEAWREQNQAGYVLNVKPGSKPAKLHRASCRHLYSYNPHFGDFTNKKKICSTDRPLVETWAKREGIQFDLCSRCDV